MSSPCPLLRPRLPLPYTPTFSSALFTQAQIKRRAADAAHACKVDEQQREAARTREENERKSEKLARKLQMQDEAGGDDDEATIARRKKPRTAGDGGTGAGSRGGGASGGGGDGRGGGRGCGRGRIGGRAGSRGRAARERPPGPAAANRRPGSVVPPRSPIRGAKGSIQGTDGGGSSGSGRGGGNASSSSSSSGKEKKNLAETGDGTPRYLPDSGLMSDEESDGGDNGDDEDYKDEQEEATSSERSEESTLSRRRRRASSSSSSGGGTSSRAASNGDRARVLASSATDSDDKKKQRKERPGEGRATGNEADYWGTVGGGGGGGGGGYRSSDGDGRQQPSVPESDPRTKIAKISKSQRGSNSGSGDGGTGGRSVSRSYQGGASGEGGGVANGSGSDGFVARRSIIVAENVEGEEPQARRRDDQAKRASDEAGENDTPGLNVSAGTVVEGTPCVGRTATAAAASGVTTTVMRYPATTTNVARLETAAAPPRQQEHDEKKPAVVGLGSGGRGGDGSRGGGNFTPAGARVNAAMTRASQSAITVPPQVARGEPRRLDSGAADVGRCGAFFFSLKPDVSALAVGGFVHALFILLPVCRWGKCRHPAGSRNDSNHAPMLGEWAWEKTVGSVGVDGWRIRARHVRWGCRESYGVLFRCISCASILYMLLEGSSTE